MDTNCRTCSRQDEFQGVSVNSISENHQEPIYLMLIYCTQLQFSTNDTLPQQICPDCLVLLEGAFNFWKQCRQTDANFRYGAFSSTDVVGVNPSVRLIAFSETAMDGYHCCVSKCTKKTTSLVELEEHAKQEHFLKRRGFELQQDRCHAHVCSVCLAGFETLANWEAHQMLLHGMSKKGSHGDESSDLDEWPEQDATEELMEQAESNVEESNVDAEDHTGWSGKKKRKSVTASRGSGSVLFCNGCGYQSNKKYNMSRHQQVWGHDGVTSSTAEVIEAKVVSEYEETVAVKSENDSIQFVEVPVKMEPTPNEADCDEIDGIEELQTNEEKSRHQCAYCGMVLYSKTKKLRHLQFSCTALYKPRKSNSKQCPKCNKKFNSTGLHRHMQFCSLGKPRKECPHCGRGFNKSSNLTRHISLNYCTRKKFQCKFCLAWYGKNAALTRHLNNGCPVAATVELTEPPKRSDSPRLGRVECPHCYSRLSRPGNLRRHMKESCHVLLKRRETAVEEHVEDTVEGNNEETDGETLPET